MKDIIIYDNVKWYSNKINNYYRNDKYGGLHRYIWEQNNGPISKGYLIHHRDEDKHNNDISNLECLSASEHMSQHQKGKITSDKTKMLMSVASKGIQKSKAHVHALIKSRTGIHFNIKHKNGDIWCNTGSKNGQVTWKKKINGITSLIKKIEYADYGISKGERV